MVTENKYALAKVIMFGKEHIVLLRPAGSLLEMFELDYDFQVKKHTEFADLVPEVDVDPEELDMTKSLIETKTAPTFDLAAYKDRNTEQLKELVEAKVAGKEIVAPPAQEHAQVLSLMEALKQSMAQVQGGAKPAEPAERPPKKVAPSTPGKTAVRTPKRKTS